MKISINKIIGITCILSILIVLGCNSEKKDGSMDSTATDTIVEVEIDSIRPHFDEMPRADSSAVPSTIPKTGSLAVKATALAEDLSETYETIQIGEDIMYVVEGDLLMSRRELSKYSLEILRKGIQPASNKLSIGKDEAGNHVKWPNGHILKFAVLESTFKSHETYLQTVTAIKEAAKDWMAVCNIRFEHLIKLDNGHFNGSFDSRLTFIIRQFDGKGKFNAKAFYPNDPRAKRSILIDPSFFDMKPSKSGVLRHELGHVLGFRHEHIWRNGSGCPSEEIILEYLGAELLTEKADCSSIMHYACGKCGPDEMKLSLNDKKWAKEIYGSPKD